MDWLCGRMHLFVVSLISMTMFSCSQKYESSLKHETGHPVAHGFASWFWANESEQDYFRVTKQNLPELAQSQDAFLPADHPVVQRIEYWQNKIDSMLRSKFPDMLAGIPVPKAKVARVDAAQGMVLSTVLCLENVDMVSGGDGPEAAATVLIEASLSEHWTRDPFDRLITSHAKLENGYLITRDETIRAH